MADVIENRIVEMDFDGEDFDKGISKSIKSIEDLNKALEFKGSTKGFEEIQNAVKKLDFSSLTDSAKSIESSFTTLAGSLERNFFDTISNRIISLGEQFTNSTIGQIISGGKTRALNIERAKFKVQGMGADWNTVYEDMDYAVSGTAYGIDSAANAAAQFLASSVETGKDMKNALRAISGVAAMTSASYDEIADVFTSAAGKGKVQAMELNRLSTRGINAAATLAKYLGTTESAVRDLATKGQIDFQTFANAMDDAFGEHAKEANKTFEGSLSNVKAALSRIGEIWYEPWLQGMIPVFNDLRTVIDTYKNALKTPMDSGGNTIATALSDLMASASNAFDLWVDTWQPLLDNLPFSLENIFNGLNKITKVFDNLGLLFKYFRKQQGDSYSYNMADAIQNEANATGKSAEWVTKKIDDYIHNTEHLEYLGKETIDEISDEIVKGGGNIHDVVEAIDGEFKAAKKEADSLTNSIEDLSDAYEEMSNEEYAYWQAFNYRKLFESPGISIKDYYETFLNVSNDIATLTSKLGKNEVTLTKSTAALVTEALDKYQSVWDKYHNVLNDSINVYTKWNTNYTLTFNKLKKNLESNKKGLTQLAKDMETLAKNGASKELLDELKSQGASGAELVHALSKASKKELAQYEKDRKALTDLEKSTTDSWTKEEKTKYEEAISKLVGFSGVTIEEAKSMYNDIFKQMGIENATSYSTGVSSVYDSIENTITSLETSLDKYAKYVSSASDEVVESVEEVSKSTVNNNDDSGLAEFAMMIETRFPGIISTLDSLDALLMSMSTLFEGVVHNIASVAELIGSAFAEVVGEFGPNVYSLSDLIDNIGNSLLSIDYSGRRGELIKSAFKGIFSVFEFGRYIIEMFLNFLNNIFFPELDSNMEDSQPLILRIAGAIGEFVYEIVALIEEGGSLPDILTRIATTIGDVIDNVSTLFRNGNDGLGIVDFLNTIIDTISTAVTTLLNFLLGSTPDSSSGGLFSGIVQVLFGDEDGGGIITAVSSVVSEIIYAVSDSSSVISTLFTTVADVISSIGKILQGQTNNIGTFLDDIFKFIHNIFVALSKEEDGGVAVVGKTLKTIFTTITDIFTTISEVFKDMAEPFKALAYSIALIIQSIALMINGITEWVRNDPQNAYGAAAFFVLMMFLNKWLEVMLNVTGVIAAIKSVILAAKTALSMGIMVGFKETILDKLQKIGIAIGAIMLGISALVLAITEAYKATGGNIGEIVLILVGVVAVFIVAVIGVIAILVTVAKIFGMLLGEESTGGSGGKGLKGIITRLNPKKAFQLLLIGEAFKLVTESIGTLILEIVVAFVALTAVCALVFMYAGGAGIAAIIVSALIIGGIITGLIFLIKTISGAIAFAGNAEKNVFLPLLAIAGIIFITGIAISSILISILFLISALSLIFIKTGNLGAVTVIMIAIGLLIGGLFIAIYKLIAITTKGGAIKNLSAKNLLSIGAIIILVTAAIRSIINSIILLTTAITLGIAATGGSFKPVLLAIGTVALIGVALGALIGTVAGIAKKVSSLENLIGVAAIMGIMVNMFAFAINQIILGLISLSFVSLDQNTIAVFKELIGFVELMVESMLFVFTIISAVLGGSAIGSSMFIGISLGFIAIAMAVYMVSKAVKNLALTLVLLATAWPTIENTLPRMLESLSELVPMMGNLFRQVVDQLCVTIISRAPQIATAIITVISLVILLFAQKIPILVGTWILIAAEVLDLIILGMDLLLPKVNAIIFLLLDFLSQNAGTYSYMLSITLLRVLWGAFSAIYDFLVDKFDGITDTISEFMLWFHSTLTGINWNIGASVREVTDNGYDTVIDAFKRFFWNLTTWLSTIPDIGYTLIKDLFSGKTMDEAWEDAWGNAERRRTNSLNQWTTGYVTGNYVYDEDKKKAVWVPDSTYRTHTEIVDLKPWNPSNDFASDLDDTHEQLLDAYGRNAKAFEKEWNIAEKAADIETDIAIMALTAGAGAAGNAAKTAGSTAVKTAGKEAFTETLAKEVASEAYRTAAGTGFETAAKAAAKETAKQAQKGVVGGLVKEGAKSGALIGFGSGFVFDSVTGLYMDSAKGKETSDLDPHTKTYRQYQQESVSQLNSLGGDISVIKDHIFDAKNAVVETTGQMKQIVGGNTGMNYDLSSKAQKYLQDTQINSNDIVGRLGFGDGSDFISGLQETLGPALSVDEDGQTVVNAELLKFGDGNVENVESETISFDDGMVDSTEFLNYGDGEQTLYGPWAKSNQRADETDTYGTTRGLDAVTQLLGGNNTNWGTTPEYTTGIGNDDGSLITVINSLQEQINSLQSYIAEAFGSTIVMPKDTEINITQTMDSKVLGTAVYPVIKSFSNEDDALTKNGLNAPKRTVAYTNPQGLVYYK